MAGDAFKAKLARVEALRTVDDQRALLAGLRRALGDRSNFVVAKAAAVAASRSVIDVVPDLLTAYERFFDPAPNVDPLVLAKHAVARALKELDHRDPAPFVRGLAHIQLEAVWGRLEDHAGEFRATCAHGLTACDIATMPLLLLLVDRLVDADALVRREVVRAIAQVGGDESILILRLKTLTGDVEPEVMGECFAALLDRAPRESVAFIERFIDAPQSEIGVEAVSVLAASREPAAFAAVQIVWQHNIPPDLRRAIVYGCGASPLAAAAEFLLSLVNDERSDLALAALTALGTSRFRNDLQSRALDLARASDDERVIAAWERAFAPARE